MEKYLSVSEFAELFNINRQTLHFYDQKGLFQPEYRDPDNHYRKYSHNQISQFSFITYLRTIGFSIDQIKTIMQCGDIDYTMNQLAVQSEHLMKQYQEIFKIERIIQRKLKFVKQKLESISYDHAELRHCPPKAYIPIGTERVLYENEAFYYFPTIVFYRYLPKTGEYEKVFAADISLDDSVEEHADRAQYTRESDYLCFYHRGPYTEIPDAISFVRNRYRHLGLSEDVICTNIVDQFLETDSQKFVTEIQILIKNS